MSDHYDILRDTQYGILGTNLAEVGKDVPDINVGNKAQLSDKGTTFENGGEIKRWSKDIISRQAAIEVVQNRHMMLSKEKVLLINDLEKLPPAEPKRIRGKWIYGEDSMADCVDGYRCDQCGFFVPWDYQHKSIDYIKDYNLCPNCGAKMEVTE